MPKCPNCHTTHTRRKGGCCPHCFVPVINLDGVWVLYNQGSPNKIILKAFENYVSEQQNCQFNIPPKGMMYKVELKTAGELYEMADFDMQLVMATMNILFTDGRFAWKTRSTLLTIRRDFNLALAIAREFLRYKKREEMLEQEAARRLAEREPLFSK